MNPSPFSAETRALNLEHLEAGTPPVDLLVVGGGITGAGIARDAARRGFRVGLLERKDFAAGTSGRSSKLIHGGVRYLQLGHFGVVRESALERRTLGRIAPHLVRPILMVVPAHSRRSHLALNVGLWTYERLGNIAASERHTMWDRATTLSRVPLLRPDHLQGAVAYLESITDDARLVIETLKDAHAAGALIANYATVTALHLEGGRVAGVRARDAAAGRDVDIAARVVVNAAGPWVDAVRCLDGPLPAKRLRLTKGIHLTLPRECLPVDQIVAFRAHDRRTTFVVPRGNVVYVGTTDTDYEGPVDHPETTAGDVEYLLEAVNRSFVDVEIRPDTVCSAWAGLRPLLHEEGKAPSEVSRKDEIMVGPSGLISIAGGKLTTYRSMAARIVDLAREALERLGVRPSVVPCATDRLPLPGGGASSAELQGLEKRLADRYRDIPATTIARLASTYGTQSETVLLPVSHEPELGQPVAPGVRLLGAEIRYSLDHEMALALEDVLDRRTHLLLFGRDQGLAAVEPTAAALARRLGWSADRLDRESVAYRQLAATLRPTGRPSPARAQHGDGRHAKERAR